MRRGWWLGAAVAVALATSCAVPDSQPYIHVAANATETPRVVGARGPLSPAESRRVIEKLERESGGSDLLRRHLAIEEALAGEPLVAGNKVTLLENGPATF
jgi:cardiolipin synthase